MKTKQIIFLTIALVIALQITGALIFFAIESTIDDESVYVLEYRIDVDMKEFGHNATFIFPLPVNDENEPYITNSTEIFLIQGRGEYFINLTGTPSIHVTTDTGISLKFRTELKGDLNKDALHASLTTIQGVLTENTASVSIYSTETIPVKITLTNQFNHYRGTVYYEEGQVNTTMIPGWSRYPFEHIEIEEPDPIYVVQP